MKKKFIKLLSPEKEKEFYKKYLKKEGLTERWLNNPNLSYEIWKNWDGLNECTGTWLIISKKKWGCIHRQKIED